MRLRCAKTVDDETSLWKRTEKVEEIRTPVKDSDNGPKKIRVYEWESVKKEVQLRT